jgi:flap endonuclease-1
MGIKNLIQMIKKYAPNSIKYKTIDAYKNSRLAIDANLMVYKTVYAIRMNGYDIKNNGLSVTHIHGIMQKLVAFRKYNITPIFVFDNIPSKMKDDTLIARKKLKQHLKNMYDKAITQDEKKKYFYGKSDITGKEIDDVMELIKIFGYQIIVAKEEADAELSYLSKYNLVDAIVTDDMDILVFGGRTILKNFTVSTKKFIQEISLPIFLQEAKLTQRQLIDIAIMIGCDYCTSVKGIGPMKGYNLIKKYGSLEKIGDVTNNQNEIRSIRKYFLNPPLNLKNIGDKKKLNKKKLILYLKENEFKIKYIDSLLTKL